MQENGTTIVRSKVKWITYTQFFLKKYFMNMVWLKANIGALCMDVEGCFTYDCWPLPSGCSGGWSPSSAVRTGSSPAPRTSAWAWMLRLCFRPRLVPLLLLRCCCCSSGLMTPRWPPHSSAPLPAGGVPLLDCDPGSLGGSPPLDLLHLPLLLQDRQARHTPGLTPARKVQSAGERGAGRSLLRWRWRWRRTAWELLRQLRKELRKRMWKKRRCCSLWRPGGGCAGGKGAGCPQG